MLFPLRMLEIARGQTNELVEDIQERPAGSHRSAAESILNASIRVQSRSGSSRLTYEQVGRSQAL